MDKAREWHAKYNQSVKGRQRKEKYRKAHRLEIQAYNRQYHRRQRIERLLAKRTRLETKTKSLSRTDPKLSDLDFQLRQIDYQLAMLKAADRQDAKTRRKAV